MGQDLKNEKPAPSLRTDLWAAALAALASFAAVAVYVTTRATDNAGSISGSGTAAVNTTPGTAAIGNSEAKKPAQTLVAFVYKTPPASLPEVMFTDAGGNEKTLKDFLGKTVLLNLWATWCAPCREEMPSLDRLQQQLGSAKFEVVALALERGGAEAARKFLDGVGVKSLALYVDKSTRAGSDLKAIGMPTTILIDPEGREIGRLAGPAQWDSEDAQRLVGKALK
jgi:thiol-disulfide isomerase/thioredoxin